MPERMALTSIDALPGAFGPQHRTLVAHLGEVAQGLLGAAEDPKAIARALGERFDLYRYLLPDGGAIDVRSLVLIREALGFASPLADAIFAVQGLGTYPIVKAGSAAQMARYLPDARRGARIAGFALTEPDAGSDVASLSCQARLEGDEWLLDGDKVFISNVGIAQHYVVFAKVSPDTPGADPDERRRISAFIVEHDAPGLELVAQELSIPHPIGALRLRGCRVGKSALLGAVGGGFKLAMQTLDTFRISVGAAACGMASAALDDALAFVCARRQFGQPLSEQQMIQGYLADMVTELAAARLLVVRAALRKDLGEEPSRPAEVAMAKMFATEAAQRIIDRAVQLHGGRGVLRESRVENLYRDIRPLRIYEGTTEIQRLIIARALLAAVPPAH
jgi:acyl-CoA dehydrogenase